MDKANSKICSVIEFQSLGTENENFFMSSRHSRLRWTGGRSIARIFKMIQVCGLNGEGLVNQNHTLPCSWDQKLNSCPLWCLSILFFRVRVGGQRSENGRRKWCKQTRFQIPAGWKFCWYHSNSIFTKLELETFSESIPSVLLPGNGLKSKQPVCHTT